MTRATLHTSWYGRRRDRYWRMTSAANHAVTTADTHAKAKGGSPFLDRPLGSSTLDYSADPGGLPGGAAGTKNPTGTKTIGRSRWDWRRQARQITPAAATDLAVGPWGCP